MRPARRLGGDDESTDGRDVLVIIPAYNEENAVAATIAGVRGVGGTLDVIVVDDGSSDRTAQTAECAGARAIRLPFNTGVGGAVRTGLRYAQYGGYERAVVLDADGQHDPSGIKPLLEALSTADIVVGSRFTHEGGSYPISGLRRTAMRSLAWLVRRRTGQRFTDVTCGFRAFGRSAIEIFADAFPSEYLADTVEVLIIAHAAELAVTEVPVKVQPRVSGLPSTRKLALAVNYFRLLAAILGTNYKESVLRLKRGAA